jgi:class 3 adenylate cyclase
MPRLQYKSFATPDELRNFPNGQAEVVGLDESSVGRAVFEPGWRWSTDMSPIVGTESCQLRHFGYQLTGTMRVLLDDGQTLDIPSETVFEIPPGHDAWVVGDEPVRMVEWTSLRSFGVAAEGQADGVLLTVLFTDIVDSTATLKTMGDAAWRDLLLVHNARLREDLNTFRGREVKTTGDGFIAVFDSASRAVRCANSMTRSAREVGLPIRAGVHTGEVELSGSDARGLAVHTAARVMGLAEADEVLVSTTTAALLEGSGLTLEDAGTHEMKGLSGARQVLRLIKKA